MIQLALGKVESSLAEEQRVVLERARQPLPSTKRCPTLILALERLGRVNYEYRYRITLAHFWARYPKPKIEEDPYATLPEDDNVPMEVEVLFDDSDPPIT
ncbi:hypothetical protein B296_00043707 [Ensete ventricosum]|uniref:Uncharacterized protein n=1 Tax=Ensete ventricosum TaxID=4639 RepID=A0A426ZDM7_ENSVE|nr:hypothetical protein B296_00043707 [Ensete ventricosum]